MTEPTTEQLQFERDQYASAIRQLILQVKQTAYVWSQTLPDTIPTAEVVKALGLLAPRPLPEGLRDDPWQRIVGAYYLRFENDGHPEDSKAAADEAMTVVQPELERRDAEIASLREELRKAKRAADLLAADHRALERVEAAADDLDARGNRTMDSSMCAAAGLIRRAIAEEAR